MVNVLITLFSFSFLDKVHKLIRYNAIWGLILERWSHKVNTTGIWIEDAADDHIQRLKDSNYNFINALTPKDVFLL